MSLAKHAHRNLSKHCSSQATRNQNSRQQRVTSVGHSRAQEQTHAGEARHKGHNSKNERDEAEQTEESRRSHCHAEIEEKSCLQEEDTLGVHRPLHSLHLAQLQLDWRRLSATVHFEYNAPRQITERYAKTKRRNRAADLHLLAESIDHQRSGHGRKHGVADALSPP